MRGCGRLIRRATGFVCSFTACSRLKIQFVLGKTVPTRRALGTDAAVGPPFRLSC